MKTIGTLQVIYRYPVKSMKGENLPEIRVERYGLYADRSHAFIDLSRGGKYLSGKQVPDLLGYSARLVGSNKDGPGSSGYPAVAVTSPNGEEFGWDERLFREMGRISERQLDVIRLPLDEPAELSANERGLMAFDLEQILITTEASLKEMERLAGRDLDMRRFRPNLVIASEEDRPFVEWEWIGKKLAIGEAVLEIVQDCRRCSMITVDPETGEADPSVLQTVNREQEGCFGVYAQVIRTGEIRLGQSCSMW